jgi:hypothetical protein
MTHKDKLPRPRKRVPTMFWNPSVVNIPLHPTHKFFVDLYIGRELTFSATVKLRVWLSLAKPIKSGKSSS